MCASRLVLSWPPSLVITAYPISLNLPTLHLSMAKRMKGVVVHAISPCTIPSTVLHKLIDNSSRPNPILTLSGLELKKIVNPSVRKYKSFYIV